MKQCQVRLDENLYQELMALKKRNGIPVAESLRRAIIEYLKKHQMEKTNEDHQGSQDTPQPDS